jgi:hypothetical protein
VLEIGTSKLYVDPSTGQVLRKVATTPRGEQVTEYSDWKRVGDLNLPSKFRTTRNGEEVARGDIQSVEFNVNVDPAIFKKP